MAVAKSSNEYIFTDVDDIDITDPEAVELGVKVNDFQLIVNCAAFTDVDRAERQEDIAEMINATAAGYLAKAAKRQRHTNDMYLHRLRVRRQSRQHSTQRG